MRVDIVHKSKPLRRIAHEGQVYVQAPKKGSYKIQLYNHCNQRRLAVVTVDGVNVITGEDGDFEGPGYILGPWETMEIPGWRRGDEEVAAFLFRPEKQSYAAQTGRGTRNVGVVGVAVFDEKKKPTTYTIRQHHHHHHHHPVPVPIYPSPTWWYTTSTTTSVAPEENTSAGVFTCSTSGEQVEVDSSYANQGGLGFDDMLGETSPRETCRASGKKGVFSQDSIDVGTGYGHKVEFQTTSVEFDRATDTPAEVVVLRYATRERLQSWGVPVDQMQRPKPEPKAFPASRSLGVPAPPGWRG